MPWQLAYNRSDLLLIAAHFLLAAQLDICITGAKSCTSPRVPLPPGWPRLICRAVELGKLWGGSGTSPFSCTSPPAQLRKVQPSSSALQPGREVYTWTLKHRLYKQDSSRRRQHWINLARVPFTATHVTELLPVNLRGDGEGIIHPPCCAIPTWVRLYFGKKISTHRTHTTDLCIIWSNADVHCPGTTAARNNAISCYTQLKPAEELGCLLSPAGRRMQFSRAASAAHGPDSPAQRTPRTSPC